MSELLKRLEWILDDLPDKAFDAEDSLSRLIKELKNNEVAGFDAMEGRTHFAPEEIWDIKKMSDLTNAIELVDADQSDNGAVGLFEARALVVEAARKYANGTREWLCQYPEFNDEGCVVAHNPKLTRQPRKHSECGWFITVALGVTEDE